MKKLLLLAFFTISIIACKESKKNSIIKNETAIIFKDLDSIKSKQQNEIENYLKKCNYIFLSNQSNSFQWKSELNDDIIQFNGKGVFSFLTYNFDTYDKLIIALKKSTYKYSGKSIKNNLEVESYTKNKEIIFLSTIDDTEKGKKVYTFTFI